MKIAVVSNGYPCRGESNFTGAFVEDRALFYRESGEEVVVFARPLRAASVAAERGVTVYRLPIRKAIAEIAKWKPDVLAVHAPHRYSLTIAEKLPFPAVFWFHGWEVEINHPVFASLPFLLRKGVGLYDLWKFHRLKKVLAREPFVIFNSRWLRQRGERNLSMRLPESKTFAISNPVDLRKFSPVVGGDGPSSDNGSNQETVSSHGSEKLRGVTMSRLLHHKGIDLLIRAASGLANTEIAVYGKGPEEKKLKDLIDKHAAPVELKSETFPHENVPEILAQYDYAVLPSRYEPQGLFLLESMACGLPGAAFRVGGIPEYFQDGVCGYLAEPESVSSLREALQKLVNSHRLPEMGKNARKIAESFCSSEKIIPREIEVLKEAARFKR